MHSSIHTVLARVTNLWKLGQDIKEIVYTNGRRRVVEDGGGLDDGGADKNGRGIGAAAHVDFSRQRRRNGVENRDDLHEILPSLGLQRWRDYRP